MFAMRYELSQLLGHFMFSIERKGGVWEAFLGRRTLWALEFLGKTADLWL